MRTWWAAVVVAGIISGTTIAHAQGFLVGNWVDNTWPGTSERTYHFKKSGDYVDTERGTPREGAWEYSQNICWVAERTGSKSYGNLLVYIGDTHCCYLARIVGSKLVLHEVGSAIGCDNKTLTRAGK